MNMKKQLMCLTMAMSIMTSMGNTVFADFDGNETPVNITENTTSTKLLNICGVDLVLNDEIFNVESESFDIFYNTIKENQPNSNLKNKLENKQIVRSSDYELSSSDLLEIFLSDLNVEQQIEFFNTYENSTGVIDLDYQNNFLSVSLNESPKENSIIQSRALPSSYGIVTRKSDQYVTIVNEGKMTKYTFTCNFNVTKTSSTTAQAIPVSSSYKLTSVDVYGGTPFPYRYFLINPVNGYYTTSSNGDASVTATFQSYYGNKTYEVKMINIL